MDKMIASLGEEDMQMSCPCPGDFLQSNDGALLCLGLELGENAVQALFLVQVDDRVCLCVYLILVVGVGGNDKRKNELQ